MLIHLFDDLFYLDTLASIMVSLVIFIGLIVILFAAKYLKGDSRYTNTIVSLALLILSVITLVSSDNLLMMLFAWLCSNAILVSLMIHKPQWRAALNAGILTAKTFSIGLVFLASAFSLLYWRTGATSIQAILALAKPTDVYVTMALILMLVSVMTQSAIWPFHRWLLSSLNSPTPVSAIMHAGLVNGGGFLLARFAPLYLANPIILQSIFVIGIITACIGTTFKLIQHDAKRMLACSTMGQMGFMLAQCGLGLFPAAISHLCYHGLFKANLFLSVNNSVKECRQSAPSSPSLINLISAILCGLTASYCFALAIQTNWITHDTRMILIGLTFIAGTQFALSLLECTAWKNIPYIVIATVTAASLYGWCLHLTETAFASSNIMQPQALNSVYLFSFMILTTLWLIGLFKHSLMRTFNQSTLYHAVYMKILNSSQPHPSTITSYRNNYQF